MMNRRAFLQNAVVGGAAFGFGLKLGLRELGAGRRVVLHGFLPADEAAVHEAMTAFLGAVTGDLPAATLDVAPRWRGAVAAGLRLRADDLSRDRAHTLTVQVADLGAELPADLLVQRSGRVLDPAGEFDRRALALRESLRGARGQLAFSARLETRRDDLAAGRVLVVENEKGQQDRIALDGPRRTHVLAGPAGRTVVEYGQGTARVREASCKHATCRLQGEIARPGELIACAPNRLVLRVETA